MNLGIRLLRVLTVACAMAFVVPSSQLSAGVIINGVTYSPTATTESLTALFTDSSGTQSVNSYFGFVEIIVSGTGASNGTLPNDAFYVFEGTPDNNLSNYQLVVTKGSNVVNGSFGDDLAIKNILYDEDAGMQVSPTYIPAYRADHTYKFVIDTTRLPGGSSQLRFGVNDGSYGDNAGQYDITVTQLDAGPISTVPEPTSFAVYAVGMIGLVLGYGRRKAKLAD